MFKPNFEKREVHAGKLKTIESKSSVREKNKLKINENGFSRKISPKKSDTSVRRTKLKINENGFERKTFPEKSDAFRKNFVSERPRLDLNGKEVKNTGTKIQKPGKKVAFKKPEIGSVIEKYGRMIENGGKYIESAKKYTVPKNLLINAVKNSALYATSDRNVNAKRISGKKGGKKAKYNVTVNASEIARKTGVGMMVTGKAAKEVGKKVMVNPDPKFTAVGAAIITGGEIIEKGGAALESFGSVTNLKVNIRVPERYSKAVSFAEKLKIAERNEHNKRAETVLKNKLDGCSREEAVGKQLAELYPQSKGYSIIREAYLRTKDGKIAKDSETGKARRIDFVVVKDGKIVKSAEVTSKTADKRNQSAKEQRIKENGGAYIMDKTGKLIRHNIDTDIERRV